MFIHVSVGDRLVKIYKYIKLVLHGILDVPLTVLFPKSIKNQRGKSCDKKIERTPDLYRSMYQVQIHQDVQYILKYKDIWVKDMIWKFKYFLNRDAMQTCTYILYDHLVADASDRIHRIPFRSPYILLHYPSSTYFKGEKKFDHMKELILSIDVLQNTGQDVDRGHLDRSLNGRFFTCCTHAILPNRNTLQGLKSQHTGSRGQRLVWAKDRFTLSPNFEKYMQEKYQSNHLSINPPYGILKLNTNYIYCIDDVVTTGASMHSASKLLEGKFNVQVIKFCICH